MGLLNDVGAGVDIASGVGSLITGLVQDSQNNYWQQKNYENQLQQLQYQKDVQNTVWKREDNAVQRRMADLKLAGINPIMAAGSAASSSAPIAVTSPEHGKVSYTSGFDRSSIALAALSANANIAQTQAQIQLINEQKRKASAEARMALHDANIWDRSPNVLTSVSSAGKDVTSMSSIVDSVLHIIFPALPESIGGQQRKHVIHKVLKNLPSQTWEE